MADRTRIAEARDTGSADSGSYREVDTHTHTNIHIVINNKDSSSHWSLCVFSIQLAEEADVFCQPDEKKQVLCT